MKASEIKVGGLYRAKVSGRVTTVRVDAIRETEGRSYGTTLGTTGRVRGATHYDVTNLATGRKTTFRSAAKFRGTATPPKPTVIVTNPKPLDPTSAASDSDPSEVSSDDAAPPKEHAPGDPGFDPSVVKSKCRCPRCRAIRSGTPLPPETTPPSKEDEKRPDPTPASSPPTSDTTSRPAQTGRTAPSASSDSKAAATTPAAGTAAAPGSSPRPTSKLSGVGLGEATRAVLSGKVAGYTPTDEQQSVIDVAKTDDLRVLVISAGAGAGKTSTLRMLEETLTGRGQYTAFNKSLVAESKAKFHRATCSTTHSLAFRAIGHDFAHRLNGDRVRSDLVARTLGIADFAVETGEVDVKTGDDGKEVEVPRLKWLQKGFLMAQVTHAIRRFCQSADREIGEEHFRYIDGIDQPKEGRRQYTNNGLVRKYLLPFAQAAWKDLSNPAGVLPTYSHDCYVKSWQLGQGKNKPHIAADYILLDEAQDTAPVFLDILKQQSHALLIFVGDSNQQIYEWRGAVDAMRAFKNAPRRLLSQSFRFGQSVADVANSILADLEEPTDLVMRGLDTIPSIVDPQEVIDGGEGWSRCVLARTNAAAVAKVLTHYKSGGHPHLIGGGADVVSFVRAAKDLQEGRKTGHPELCCFESWKEVQAYVSTDEGEDLKLMVRLIDEFGAEEIIEALEHMPDEDKATLVVSTAHKSKGREWDEVFLASDFPVCRSDADRRLLYVAATRARFVLHTRSCPAFVGETDKETGDQIPGIEVTYTRPMPSQEQLESHLRERASKSAAAPKSPETPIVRRESPAPANRRSESGNGTGGAPVSPSGNVRATWYKHNDAWVVRASAEMEGKTVTVTRRNGGSSQERLGQVVQKYQDAWLYRTVR